MEVHCNCADFKVIIITIIIITIIINTIIIITIIILFLFILIISASFYVIYLEPSAWDISSSVQH